ncbi:unnamed protein product [Chilo suppressalis]|uniref:Uncharacterized protein n=1 Tax=Chilo suppressalis TaxID=168631 RepID=A0ABN8AZZ4_CHISP|nr:unnamed protein product [Chilo suppressalis]
MVPCGYYRLVDVEDQLLVYELHDDSDDFNTADNAEHASRLPSLVADRVSITPSTSRDPAPPIPAPTHSYGDQPPDNETRQVVLDDEILIFLGDVPSKDKKFGPKLQNNIAKTWEHVATSGVSKIVKKEFLEKYLTPENCKLIDPPILNLEVKAALSETLQKKDTAIHNKQKQISAAISCIG